MKISIVEDATEAQFAYVDYVGRVGFFTEAIIHIPPPDKKDEPARLAMLLHELAHVAGVVVGTLAQRTDVRFLGGFYLPTHSTILAAEREAWDLADQMYDEIKTFSKSSYGIGDIP